MAQKSVDLTSQIPAPGNVFQTPAFVAGSSLLALTGATQRPSIDYNEDAGLNSITLPFAPVQGQDTLTFFYEPQPVTPTPVPSPGGAGLASDMADLLGIWGDPSDGTGPGLLTIVRPTFTTSDSGASTPTFGQVDQQPGVVQPYRYSGQAEASEPGVKAFRDFIIFFPVGTNILENDRVRPPGWVAGQDDYYVEKVSLFAPSHMEVIVMKVTGHAS